MSELKLQQCRVDGRYDVLECLGRGSYSEVYVARDVAASNGGPQTVVLKALNTHLQGEPDAELEHTLIVNFRNEAIALDRVRHPNIISRLGHGTAIDLSGRTFHYLVLEYLPGGDLQALCRRKPLDIKGALHYLEQVCSGLAHAHSRGVIHRDIKPQNLLLTADQRVVKIADFGVAKLEAADGAITRVGTDIYAAPEHHPLIQTGQLDTAALVARSAVQLTPAADVYSLAKTTYMLLTGEAPRRFSQRPVSELPSPFDAEPWAGAVVRVLERATHTSPSGRYQSVGEFWNELRRASGAAGEEFAEAREVVESLGVVRRERAETEATPTAPAPSSAPAYDRPVEPTPMQPGHRDGRIFIQIAPDDRQPPQRDPQVPIWSDARPAAPDRDARADRLPPELPVPRGAGRGRKLLIVFLVLVAFAALLFATANYVRTRRSGGAQTPSAGDPSSPVGREFVAVTDVNLRAAPTGRSAQVGMAARGSIVKILAASGGWYQVQILQHGRPKERADYADQGWADRDFLRPKQ